jgi:hypothetical protein
MSVISMSKKVDRRVKREEQREKRQRKRMLRAMENNENIRWDAKGRRYAKLAHVHAGMMVQVDSGFTWDGDYEITPWATLEVKADDDGGLYIDGNVPCAGTVDGGPGRIRLEDQACFNYWPGNDENDSMIGIYHAERIELDLEEQFERDGGPELLQRLEEIFERMKGAKPKIAVNDDRRVRIRFSDGTRYPPRQLKW